MVNRNNRYAAEIWQFSSTERKKKDQFKQEIYFDTTVTSLRNFLYFYYTIE